MLMTTRQVANELGMNYRTLARYLALKKIRGPRVVRFRKMVSHYWAPEEVESLRAIAPKMFNQRMLANGKLIPGMALDLAKPKTRSKKKKRKKK